MLHLLEKASEEIELNLGGHIQMISIAVADVLKKNQEEIEKEFRNGFIQGIIDEMIKDVRFILQIEEDDDFENHISILMNELAKIDSIFIRYNISNNSIAQASIELLEKWFKTL